MQAYLVQGGALQEAPAEVLRHGVEVRGALQHQVPRQLEGCRVHLGLQHLVGQRALGLREWDIGVSVSNWRQWRRPNRLLLRVKHLCRQCALGLRRCETQGCQPSRAATSERGEQYLGELKQYQQLLRSQQRNAEYPAHVNSTLERVQRNSCVTPSTED